MTATAATAETAETRTPTTRTTRRAVAAPTAVTACALVVGFVIAVALRSAVGADEVSTSARAGITFAGCLVVLCVVPMAATPARLPNWRRAWVGAPAAVALLVPLLVARFAGAAPHRPAGSFVGWAFVVGVVAVAEEAFLRGALFEVVAARWSVGTAVVTCAVLFAGLHVPLYGWHVVPLDLVVGAWLGGVRIVGRTWLAPAVTHTVADWASWWLR